MSDFILSYLNLQNKRAFTVSIIWVYILYPKKITTFINDDTNLKTGKIVFWGRIFIHNHTVQHCVLLLMSRQRRRSDLQYGGCARRYFEPVSIAMTPNGDVCRGADVRKTENEEQRTWRRLTT